jgi:uncharacterized protein (TIGR02588 family)
MSEKKQPNNRDEGQQNGQENPARTTAEWIAFGVSLLIVVGMIGLITFLHFRQGRQPTIIHVTPQLAEVRHEKGRFYLPVDVENTGGKTAENVWVEITLSPAEGEPETGKFVIAFLANHAASTGVVIFRQDPAQGELAASVSYLEP